MPLEGWPGEKLIIKLWDTVFDRGVAGLLRPKQIIREEAARTAARRNDLLRMEQTRQDIADLRSGKKRFDEEGNLIALSAPEQETRKDQLVRIERKAEQGLITSDIKQAKELADLRETERTVNLTEILLKAEDEAEGVKNEQVSDEPIDPDWFARWRAGAEDVSSDDLQRLWSRVLAGELKSPGAFRLHTLDVLRRLSRGDAELIANAAKFYIGGDAIYRNDELLNASGLLLDELFELQELGIITGVSAVGVTKHLKSNSENEYIAYIRIIDKVLQFRANDLNKKIIIGIYPVTRVGQEILSLERFSFCLNREGIPVSCDL